MATYFADTSFWIGLSSKRDQHHLRAVAWHRFVIRTRSTIMTTATIMHQNRHMLVTERAESGAGGEVIMSIAGHVSRAMLSMRTFSVG